jgi:hypothetical protein
MTTKTSNLADQGDKAYCAHPGCSCQVQTGDKYCCDLCENQQDDGPCNCGHSECEFEQMDTT